MAVLRCLTRRHQKRLRRVICASSAAKRHNLRVRILPTGKNYPLRASALRFCHMFRTPRVNVPPSAVRPNTRNRKRHELPRRRPTHGSTRQDAGFRARRQSRLDPAETHGVTPLATRSRRRHVSRGKRRAAQPAAHLTASRGLTSRPLGRQIGDEVRRDALQRRCTATCWGRWYSDVRHPIIEVPR